MTHSDSTFSSVKKTMWVRRTMTTIRYDYADMMQTRKEHLKASTPLQSASYSQLGVCVSLANSRNVTMSCLQPHLFTFLESYIEAFRGL